MLSFSDAIYDMIHIFHMTSKWIAVFSFYNKNVIYIFHIILNLEGAISYDIYNSIYVKKYLILSSKRVVSYNTHNNICVVTVEKYSNNVIIAYMLEYCTAYNI